LKNEVKMSATSSGAVKAADSVKGGETIINSDDIKALILQGKENGFISYAQINDVLPAEAVSPEKIDEMLVLFAEMGIEVVDGDKQIKAESEAGKNGTALAAPAGRHAA
jgi:hypothetical protein